MNIPRILTFSLVYYPRYIGGAEVAVKEITDRISPSEIEFDMITLNGGGEAKVEKIGNITVHRIFREVGPIGKLFFPFGAFFKAIKLHRTRKYNATWSIMANYSGFAALFFKLTHHQIPFILTLQEGDPIDHIKRRVGILYPLLKKIFTKADRIQAISSFLADWARDMGAKCTVEVIPNGVEFGKFAEVIGDDKKDHLRKELGFSSEDRILVTASRLVQKNAINDIISSLQYLDNSYKLLILGIGQDEKALRDLVAQMKLDGRVIFKGFIVHDDLPKYLQLSDVFVRPSLSEGLGISFLEAMAAGIPVVTTPVGGIPDFLIDGETGLFCEVKNPRSIAQKVDKLMKDRESRNYIIGRAREMVREKYGWEGVVRRMRKVFEPRAPYGRLNP